MGSFVGSLGGSALSLGQAVQATVALDLFFDRGDVMGLADGDLSFFRRTWTYSYAGHLEAGDASWRWRPLKVIAKALSVDDVPMPAAPTPSAPADTSPPDGRGGA